MSVRAGLDIPDGVGVSVVRGRTLDYGIVSAQADKHSSPFLQERFVIRFLKTENY